MSLEHLIVKESKEIAKYVGDIIIAKFNLLVKSGTISELNK